MAAYQATTGLDVRAVSTGSLWVGPEPWASATPDGVARESGAPWAEAGLVELKTDAKDPGRWPESQTFERWGPDLEQSGVALDYVLQCQWQMHVLDAPWADLAVLLPWYEMRVYRLIRDRELEALMVEQVGAWHERHVVQGEPVAPDDIGEARRELADGTAPDHGQRYRARPATLTEAQLAQHLAQATAWGSAWEQQRRRLSLELCASAGRSSALLLGRDGQHGRVSIVRRGDPPSIHARLHGPIAERAQT
jgi:hypothetical protein